MLRNRGCSCSVRGRDRTIQYNKAKYHPTRRDDQRQHTRAKVQNRVAARVSIFLPHHSKPPPILPCAACCFARAAHACETKAIASR